MRQDKTAGFSGTMKNKPKRLISTTSRVEQGGEDVWELFAKRGKRRLTDGDVIEFSSLVNYASSFLLLMIATYETPMARNAAITSLLIPGPPNPGKR